MAKATPYSKIDPLEPEWLWAGRIQLGGATLLAGDGGIGKGFLLSDLAARVTRGDVMPDGTAGPPAGSVVLVTSEDDPHMAMAYRLRAAGANLRKVYDMTEEFIVPDAIPALRETIESIKDVRLVVIDPLSDVAGIPLTSSNVRVRRAIMNPLRRLAQDTGVAIVMVHHTVKSGRVGGTKGITDAARMVLRVSRLPSDDRVRVIHVEKTNIAADTVGDVAYTLGGSFPDVAVSYLDLPEDGGAPARQLSAEDRVLALLASEETAGGELEAQAIATSTGIAYGTVRVALTRLKGRGAVVAGSKRGAWKIAPAPELRPIGKATNKEE